MDSERHVGGERRARLLFCDGARYQSKLKGTLKETLSPISAANLRKAHERLESGTMIGKLVLKGWS